MTLTTISGLPAHALLVHAMVVVAPLTALLVVAVVLALVHWREVRAAAPGLAVRVVVAVVAIVVGAASIVQIVRIGDSGAQSVWGNELTKSSKP